MKIFYHKTSVKCLKLSNIFFYLALITTALMGKVNSVTNDDIKSDEIMISIQSGILSAVKLPSYYQGKHKQEDYLDSQFSPNSIVHPHHEYSKTQFKTYLPTLFQYIRKLAGMSDSDFIYSIYNLSLKKIQTASRSGALFYKSGDDKFIIKTIKKKEAKFLIQSLSELIKIYTNNPNSLLPKFFGLYSYSHQSTMKIVVIMNNLLPSNIPFDQIYNLKGSTYATELDKKDKIATQNDNVFISKYPAGINVEEKVHTALSEILKEDCKLLERLHVTDYSLLLGIYNIDHETQQNSLNTAENSQGGIPALNASREKLLLFMGITDILTYYGTRKKLERLWKSIIHGNSTSVQSPSSYAKRFQNFITKSVLIPTKNV